jgi:hypothetical protein
MNSTAEHADRFLRARTRAATVTDPRILELRAEITDLLADNRELRRRLQAMREERDRARRANRRNDWIGALWALLTNGRTR